MSGISVDIENEIASIGIEARLLRSSLIIVEADLNAQAGDDASKRVRLWLDTQGIASAIAKIYTGLERIMARIAATVDAAPLDHNNDWHAALLRRMSNPFPGIRGPVISLLTVQELNRFRAFRHFERNNYGVELELDIVLERGREILAAIASFEADLRSFLVALEREQPSPRQPR